jgi:hypothetical protein
MLTVCPVMSDNDKSSFCNTSDTRLFCKPLSDDNQLINNVSSNFCSSVSELFGFINLSLAIHIFFNAANVFLKFLADSVFSLNMTVEKYPSITFHNTSEF